MRKLRFEWDEQKATSNLKKHGVSFAEAITVFYDEYARIINDPDHSDKEDRFILMGMSAGLNYLVVCHCYREKQDKIRIISARKGTKKETDQYARWRP